MAFKSGEMLPMIRYRSTVMTTGGIVSSAHPLASSVGLRILQSGGNAVDAAIAANAVLAVTQPHMCGLGGDIFYLTYMKKDERVNFLNGTGRAAKGATIEFFAEQGLSRVPERGPLACITVPGCVDGWGTLHHRYGSMSLQELLKPAAEYASRGFPISHSLSRSIREGNGLESNEHWQMIFMPHGRTPHPGDLLIQEDLSRTLTTIGAEGTQAFYSGEIGESIIKTLHDVGGLLSREDFSSHHSDWAEPVHTKYRNFDVYETAPNSQAVTALIALNIVEEFDLRALGFQTAEEVHVLVEACKMAYADRDKFLGDPNFLDIPLDWLLSKGHASERSRLITGKSLNSRPAPERFPPKNNDLGDTTYLAVVDAEGNCVSCIQSLYNPFGSGVVANGTGVLLQNRGSYFSLDKKHHNRLEPGKRTFHTLCASLTLMDERPFLVFGSMGGDGQPQTHLQVLTNLFDHGMDIQQAIEAPRWFIPGTIYEAGTTINMESRFSGEVLKRLREQGHVIIEQPSFWDKTGHAQGILIRNGIRMGGADPRGDGAAVAY